MKQLRTSILLLTALVFISISASISSAQADLDTLWSATLGTPEYEIAYSVISTEDGYVFVGTTQENHNAPESGYVIKTDKQGNPIWEETFGMEDERDELFSVTEVSGGGYVFAGYTSSYSILPWDAYLIKMNPDGSTAWTQHYSFEGYMFAKARCVKETSDGGLIVVGRADFNRMLVFKTDADGEIEWIMEQQEFGCGYDVKCTTDGGYIVTGYYSTTNNSFLFKINADGDSEWFINYEMENSSRGKEVLQTEDGGYIVAGYCIVDNDNEDFLVFRTDSNGNIQWTSIFGNDHYEMAEGIVQDPEGGFIGVGTRVVGINWEVALFKITDEGEVLWIETYGGASYEYGSAICLNYGDEVEYLALGSTASFGAGQYDFYVLALAPTQGTAVDPQVVIPSAFSVGSAYPNPFNSSTVITFTLPIPAKVSLQIFNVTGQLVRDLGTQYPRGNHQVSFDGRNLPSGVYFAQLTAGNSVRMQKLTLLK